jgi:hypothetical protein
MIPSTIYLKDSELVVVVSMLSDYNIPTISRRQAWKGGMPPLEQRYSIYKRTLREESKGISFANHEGFLENDAIWSITAFGSRLRDGP